MFRRRQGTEERCGKSNKIDPTTVGNTKESINNKHQVRIWTARTSPARNRSPLRSPRITRPAPDVIATNQSPVNSPNTWRMASGTSSSRLSRMLSDTTAPKGSRPDLVSQDSSMLTVKSVDSCATIFSNEEGLTRPKHAYPCLSPLWKPPSRSNVEILAEIEEMVASFQFEGLEQVVITRPSGKGDISDLSSLDSVSVPDSLCAEYLTKAGLRGNWEEEPTDTQDEEHRQCLTCESDLDGTTPSNLPTPNPKFSRMVSIDSSDENSRFETYTSVSLNITA